MRKPCAMEGEKAVRKAAAVSALEFLPARISMATLREAVQDCEGCPLFAHATQAVVRLERRPGALVCSIADNGRGFDASARSAQTHSQGLGLIGMRERAASLGGTLAISSSPGKGTTLKILVPLKGIACHLESSSPTTT